METSSEKSGITIFGYIFMVIPFALVSYLSTEPNVRLHPENKAALIVSFKHITEKEHLCNEEELATFNEKFAELRPHMRKSSKLCGSRKRVPMDVKMTLDGNPFLEEVVIPAGISNDGASFIYKRDIIDAGEHTVRIVMKDGRISDGKDYCEFEKTFVLEPKKTIVLDFSKNQRRFMINGLPDSEPYPGE